MKNVLNIVTTLLIIFFFGYQFYVESCENKCDINKESKCSSEEKTKECEENTEDTNSILAVSTDSTTNIDSLLDEVQKTLIEENGSDSGTAIINEVIITDGENENSDE